MTAVIACWCPVSIDAFGSLRERMQLSQLAMCDSFGNGSIFRSSIFGPLPPADEIFPSSASSVPLVPWIVQ